MLSLDWLATRGVRLRKKSTPTHPCPCDWSVTRRGGAQFLDNTHPPTLTLMGFSDSFTEDNSSIYYFNMVLMKYCAE